MSVFDIAGLRNRGQPIRFIYILLWLKLVETFNLGPGNVRNYNWTFMQLLTKPKATCALLCKLVNKHCISLHLLWSYEYGLKSTVLTVCKSVWSNTFISSWVNVVTLAELLRRVWVALYEEGQPEVIAITRETRNYPPITNLTFWTDLVEIDVDMLCP